MWQHRAGETLKTYAEMDKAWCCCVVQFEWKQRGYSATYLQQKPVMRYHAEPERLIVQMLTLSLTHMCMTNGPVLPSHFMLMSVWCVCLAECLYLHTPSSECPGTSLRRPLYPPCYVWCQSRWDINKSPVLFSGLKAVQWSVSKGNPSPCA